MAGSSVLAIPLLAQTPRLERVRTVGCAACDGPKSFYEIAAIALAADGGFTVLDHAEPHVRVFSADGGTVEAFGGRGRGPGEFVTPSYLLPAPDGTFDIMDIGARRTVRIDAKGKELAASPFRDFPIAADAPAARAHAILATTDFRTPTLAIDVWNRTDDPERIVRFTPDFPLKGAGEPSIFVSLAAAPDGTFAVGEGNFEYRIRIYDLRGGVVREIVRDIANTRRTPQELAAETARQNRQRSRAQAMRQVESSGSRVLPLPPINVPETEAYFLAHAFAFDPSGRLWVRTERGGSDDTIFDLFDPEGSYLGDIRVNERIGRFVVAHGFLAGVTRDADEAQYVTVFRLVE
jgi:hypothetical protein